MNGNSTVLPHSNGNGNGKKLTLKEVQKHLIGAFVGGSMTAIVVGIVFYFNTTYTLTAHTQKFSEIEKRLTRNEEKVEALTNDVTIIKVQILSISQEIKDIKESQKQMKDDLSKMQESVSSVQQDLKRIYEILLSSRNK